MTDGALLAWGAADIAVTARDAAPDWPIGLRPTASDPPRTGRFFITVAVVTELRDKAPNAAAFLGKLQNP